MYNFFMDLINNASSLIDMGRRQDVASKQSEAPAVEPVYSKETSIAISEENDLELEILSREFGELSEGKQIVVELSQLLLLLPRKRRKADAYKGVRAKLKKIGVELIITPNKRRNSNE
jgi:hypothetical protein